MEQRRHFAQNGGSLRRVGVTAAAYDYSAEVVRFRDLPTNPSGANGTALRARAVDDGVRVLLSGVGGDEWFFGDPGRWTDWLVGGDWRLLHAELSSWHRVADSTSWRDLVQLAILPLVPDPVRRASGAMRRSRSRLPWLTDRFQRETDLFERLRATPPPRAATYATAGMIGAVTHGRAGAAREEQDRLAARFGHDERMPYSDRRVIDFALAIPETLRSHPGCPKYITRRAWASHLPPPSSTRPSPPTTRSISSRRWSGLAGERGWLTWRWSTSGGLMGA